MICGGPAVIASYPITAKSSDFVIHSFVSGSRDGWDLRGGLIFDGSVNLYGKRESGTIFKLTPNPDGIWTESVLHRFSDVKVALGMNL